MFGIYLYVLVHWYIPTTYWYIYTYIWYILTGTLIVLIMNVDRQYHMVMYVMTASLMSYLIYHTWYTWYECVHLRPLG